MKNGSVYFKWSVVLIGIIAIVYLSRSCSCGKPKPVEVIKVVVDTVWKKQDSLISYVPTPYKVAVPYRVEIPEDNDSLILAAAIKDGLISAQSDSLSVLRDYLTTRYYDDSFAVQYGKVRVQDTVFANSIVGRGVSTSFNVPVITKTFTIEARKRNVVLFGVGLMGNKISPLYGAELSLDFKTKKDKIYEAGAVLLRGGELYYKAKLLIPISLRKK